MAVGRQGCNQSQRRMPDRCLASTTGACFLCLMLCFESFGCASVVGEGADHGTRGRVRSPLRQDGCRPVGRALNCENGSSIKGSCQQT